MSKFYIPINPITNTNLMTALNNGKKDGSDTSMQAFLNEPFNAEFLVPIDIKSNQESLYDVLMLSTPPYVYIPIFTNYFEMMKMANLQKNQKAFVMSLDEIIDIVYEVYEVLGYEIQGVILNPFSNNLFFNCELLDSMQIIMQQNRQKKVYEEIHDILLSGNNENDEKIKGEDV
jgi:hypothetical protein